VNYTVLGVANENHGQPSWQPTFWQRYTIGILFNKQLKY